MPVFAEGSTTKMPPHSEEAMPLLAAMADILSEPGVCWVALFSSAAWTTLIGDCASAFVGCVLGRGDLCIVLPLTPEHIRGCMNKLGLFPMHSTAVCAKSSRLTPAEI